MDSIELEMANRLYMADLEIAEQNHRRVVDDLARVTRLEAEFRATVEAIRAGGIEPYLEKIRGI